MHSSSARHSTGDRGKNRRLPVVIAALVLFGAIFSVTQVAMATEGNGNQRDRQQSSGRDAGDDNENANDQDADNEDANKDDNADADNKDAEELDVLADSCEGSRLRKHDGFQKGNRCVETQFGEVGRADKNPSLLITQAPRRVDVNEAFTLRVSTRNLIRDRFLAAAEGGYFKETSLLNEDGLVRGHFHTACRMVDNGREAPEPQGVPAFFVATEDNGGSDEPDEVEVQVAGLPEEGVAQCAVWAGDGSHRVPMMERANQTPPFDVVRVVVK